VNFRGTLELISAPGDRAEVTSGGRPSPLYSHSDHMPATLIMFACAATGIALWTTFRRYSRQVRYDYPPSQLQRLQQRAVWLELRLDTARQERWSRTTINSLSDQLGETCEELARAQSSSRGPVVAAQ
jgi:hypothetical protein